MTLRNTHRGISRKYSALPLLLVLLRQFQLKRRDRRLLDAPDGALLLLAKFNEQVDAPSASSTAHVTNPRRRLRWYGMMVRNCCSPFSENSALQIAPMRSSSVTSAGRSSSSSRPSPGTVSTRYRPHCQHMCKPPNSGKRTQARDCVTPSSEVGSSTRDRSDRM